MAANAYQAEARRRGRPDDGVAEVRVTQTGIYYAVFVRNNADAGGIGQPGQPLHSGHPGRSNGYQCQFPNLVVSPGH